jgi:hypothetical protein
MALRFLMIGGTGAPPQSIVYYRPILAVAEEFVNEANFETIFRLGLGDMKTAASRIGKEYIENSEDQFVICGHSQGAILASLIAKAYPDKVVEVIALAGPFKGTTWADPINMPIRGLVEAVTIFSNGRIKLKPTIRRYIIPIIPIVKDLAVHSEISEEVLLYLETQTGGHRTHAFIGSNDLAVFPHRSANPTGPNVTNYIVCSEQEYNSLPESAKDLIHINARAGHITIIFNKPVLNHIRKIIQESLITISA